MIDNILYTLLTFLILLLVVSLYFLLKMRIKAPKIESMIDLPPLPVDSEISEEISTEPISTKTFCVNHQEIESESSCQVCYNNLCHQCIHAIGSIHFCSTHLDLFRKEKWTVFLILKTSPQNPELGVFAFDLKKSIWENHQIPIYVETGYEINVDQDRVDTILSFYTLDIHLDYIKNTFREREFISSP
jgi:hypothetical protein